MSELRSLLFHGLRAKDIIALVVMAGFLLVLGGYLAELVK